MIEFTESFTAIFQGKNLIFADANILRTLFNIQAKRR